MISPSKESEKREAQDLIGAVAAEHMRFRQARFLRGSRAQRAALGCG
jgi:ABC-type sulfate/molybdate transport systems ATPase subunit